MTDLSSPITINEVIQKVNESALPDTTGHTGEFLKAGSDGLEWDSVDALPDQTGNAGKFLTTDGTDASWDYANDPNTYKSLSEAQATDLLNNGTYNGSDVDTNTIFTKEDGTFQKFEKELVPPGSYETVSSSLYGGGSYAFTTDTTIVRTSQLGYSGGWPEQYVGYSEDNGYTWGISTLDGSNLGSNGNDLRGLCAGKNSDVYGLRKYSNLYHTKFIKSVDGGKTFTSSTVLNTTDDFGFLGYLKASDVIVAIPTSSGYVKNETLYSTDGGQTFQEFNTYNTYGTTIYRIGKFDDDTIIILTNDGKVYTTTNWTTWTQIGTQSLSAMGDQWGREWNWRTTITRVGDYLVFRGSFNGGKIAYSNDEGVTWNLTQRDFPEIEGCGLFDYSEGLYIAVKSGTFYTSTDLLSGWESHSFMSYNGGADYGTENCSNLVHFNGKTFFGSNDGSALIPMSSYYRYSLAPLSYSIESLSLNSIANAGDGIRFDTGATQNFTLVGSPAVSDGIASGLDTSNYLSATTSLDTSKAWKVRTHFKLTSHDGSMGEQILAGKYPQSLNIAITNSTSQLGVDISYSGSQADLSLTGGTISTGQDYYIEVGWDGTKYYLKESTTGFDSLVETASQNSTTPMNSFTTFYMGTYEYNGGGFWGTFNGNLYLYDTEITNDGNVLWTPYAVSSKSSITLDIGTGDNAPQQSTEGYVGKLYVTSGGAVYICTGVSGSTYTWAQITVS